MSNWFYASHTGQQGPVDDDTFRRLIASGEILPGTLVWRSGMTDWEPLRTAAPEFSPPPDLPSDGPLPGLGADAPFSDLKAAARRGLDNNLGTYIGAAVLLWLILMAAQLVPFAGSLVGATILAPLFEYGLANLSLRAANRRRLGLDDGFIGFRQQFGRALSIYWLRGMYLFLWSLPAIVGTVFFAAWLELKSESVDLTAADVLPGFLILALISIPPAVKGLSYSMSSFLMLDNPSMTAKEAITESRALMNGRKMRLLLFHLSFLGWWLLTAVTFGIAGFWAIPYEKVSHAAFYRSLASRRDRPAEF